MSPDHVCPSLARETHEGGAVCPVSSHRVPNTSTSKTRLGTGVCLLEEFSQKWWPEITFLTLALNPESVVKIAGFLQVSLCLELRGDRRDRVPSTP